MSYRNFQDTSGHRWEVRPRSRREWDMEPLPGNPQTRRTVSPPLYAGDDPFELSEQELQRILDSGREAGFANPRAPWEKGEEPPDKKPPTSLFTD